MHGKRSKLTSSGSKRLFSATSRVDKRNYEPAPMRGGYRI